MKIKLLLCAYGLLSLFQPVYSATVGAAGEDTQILGDTIKLDGVAELENIETRPLVAVGGFRYRGWNNFNQTIVSYNGRLYTSNNASGERVNIGPGTTRDFGNYPKAMMHMVIDRATGDVVPIDGYPIQVHNDEAELLGAIESHFDEQYIHIILSWAECFNFTTSDAAELEEKMLSLGASREALEMTRHELPAEMGSPVGSTYGDEFTYSYVLIGIPGIGAGNGMEATQEVYDLNVYKWSSPVVSTMLLKATVGMKDNQVPRFTPVGLLNNSLIQDDGDLWAAKGIEGGASSHTNNNGGIAVGAAAIASGPYAAAFGSNTEAGIDMSLVAGKNVRLEAGYAGVGAVAFGQFNLAGTEGQGDARKPIFVVGSGTQDERKDTFVIYEDGSYQLGKETEAFFRQDWVYGGDLPGNSGTYGIRATAFEGTISLGNLTNDSMYLDKEYNPTRGVYFNVAGIYDDILSPGARIYADALTPGFYQTALKLEAATGYGGSDGASHV
ncbi:MAG: hypothetical protein E1N59_1135 [Puniceicoccaceae bacterium 5H]|nr:MAG: hypothetical protein E1N59_1135 [Puniceicoccaceae bacterium 5H]